MKNFTDYLDEAKAPEDFLTTHGLLKSGSKMPSMVVKGNTVEYIWLKTDSKDDADTTSTDLQNKLSKTALAKLGVKSTISYTSTGNIVSLVVPRSVMNTWATKSTKARQKPL